MPVITEFAGGSRTYPLDSVRVRLDPNTFTAATCYWMWRGSNFEIQWKDTLVRIGAATADSQCLTCHVWDLTNNIEVPYQGGLRKDAMTKSAWCFNYLLSGNGTLNYIYNRANNDNRAIFICGVTVYLNKKGATPRTMDWANRPETGDVWRINCSGPRPPVDGNVSTIILSPEKPGGSFLNPLSAAIYQNAPNPFADATAIRYQLPVAADVSLKIYNIAGQLVRTLVESYQAAGAHTVYWDGRNQVGYKLSAGVYLYQLRAGGNSSVKRMVLIR